MSCWVFLSVLGKGGFIKAKNTCQGGKKQKKRAVHCREFLSQCDQSASTTASPSGAGLCPSPTYLVLWDRGKGCLHA